MKLLKERNKDNVLVIVGGLIPPIDIPSLKALGLKEIFGFFDSSMKGKEMIVKRI